MFNAPVIYLQDSFAFYGVAGLYSAGGRLLLCYVSTIKHLEKMFVQIFACVMLVVLVSLGSRVVWCQVPCHYMCAGM